MPTATLTQQPKNYGNVWVARACKYLNYVSYCFPFLSVLCRSCHFCQACKSKLTHAQT